eukprot:12682455-Alexandrium_andersonii.AAC.1
MGFLRQRLLRQPGGFCHAPRVPRSSHALRAAPVMPVTPAQRKAMGAERAAQCQRARASARGSPAHEQHEAGLASPCPQ